MNHTVSKKALDDNEIYCDFFKRKDSGSFVYGEWFNSLSEEERDVCRISETIGETRVWSDIIQILAVGKSNDYVVKYILRKYNGVEEIRKRLNPTVQDIEKWEDDFDSYNFKKRTE